MSLRLQFTELARVDPGLENRLDPSLVLAAAPAERRGALAGEGGELVQEDPDVVRVAVDDVEQLVAQHGQLLRGRPSGLRHAFGTEHHFVHHPVMDGRQELLFGTDVVVQRALAEIVGGAELHDAGGVVAVLGEDGR